MKNEQTSPTRSEQSRRTFLQRSAGAVSLVVSPSLAAPALAATNKKIRIGFVSPYTGPLASFGEADEFVIQDVSNSLADGITVGGELYDVEILARDSQSNPSRASDVTTDLILRDEVNLILAAATGDTVNPVSDVAEINEVPCVTTNAPWEASYFARGGTPEQGFDWTYHFFWGLGDLLNVFTDIWNSGTTNKKVGALFSNDTEGVALSHPDFGFPKPILEAGYDLTLPGLASPMTDDYTAFIEKFANADCQILTGAVTPSDFVTFWNQAAQQGFRQNLKFATIAKAMLFPAAAEALGDGAIGITTEIWWSPEHPTRSGLTGQSSRDFSAAYSSATGRQWTQPLGFQHALLEVGIDVLKRSGNPLDPVSVRDSIAATDYNSIVGRVNWQGGGPRNPVKNVCTTPLVGGQWQKGDTVPYDLKIINNKRATDIPLTGELMLLNS